MSKRWYVCDMDEGVLAVRDTRRAALDWLRGHFCSDRVLRRQQYARGDYEYTLGSSYEDADSAWIVREDRLEAGGWKHTREPLYGDPERPHEATRDYERQG